MASPADIARAQIILGSTDRWTDDTVGDAIDSEGGVPEAAVFLLESAATAAAFQPDVTAGSQSVKQAHVAGELRRAAQRIRNQYDLDGADGQIGTREGGTGRDPMGACAVPCSHIEGDGCCSGTCAGCCA